LSELEEVTMEWNGPSASSRSGFLAVLFWMSFAMARQMDFAPDRAWRPNTGRLSCRSAPDLSSVLHDATTASIPHHVLSLRLYISVAHLDSAQLVPPKIVTLLEPCRLKSLKVLG